MPRIIKETDGGGDPSSGDEDGVPVDPPTLPPLYVPVDVEYKMCAAIVVGKYRIDGVEGTRTGTSGTNASSSTGTKKSLY